MLTCATVCCMLHTLQKCTYIEGVGEGNYMDGALGDYVLNFTASQPDMPVLVLAMECHGAPLKRTIWDSECGCVCVCVAACMDGCKSCALHDCASCCAATMLHAFAMSLLAVVPQSCCLLRSRERKVRGGLKCRCVCVCVCVRSVRAVAVRDCGAAETRVRSQPHHALQGPTASQGTA